MDFRTIAYLSWVKTTGRARINLCRSGVPDCKLSELGLDFGSLELGGQHPYGYPPLAEAIAARYGVRPHNVVTTVGTSMAIFMACAALLDRGDEALIESPAYEPLVEVPRVLGAVLKRIPRRFEHGFQVDAAEWKKAMTKGTRLAFVTNLHNPSGASMPREDLQKLAETAGERRATLLVDEVYLEFLRNSPRETAFHLGDNIAVLSSLTKVFGLTGLRCGWILAPGPMAQKLQRMKDYLFNEEVFLSEQIAARLLPVLDSLRDRHAPLIDRNKAAVREFMAGEPRLRWVEPAAGIVCFPRVEPPFTGRIFAELLQERFETSVVPGDFFEAPAHFRLGFYADPGALTEGLANMRRALDSR